MRQNKRFIAITGGIGSGKSTVADLLKERGFSVFSADVAGRSVYEDKEVFAAVQKLFPQCAANGKIDRKSLAQAVFSDENKLRALDSITHPAIMKILFKQMESAACDTVFAEVPLLFESGLENDFDSVIVVMRDRAARLKAAAARDGVSENDIRARMKNQFDYEKNPITGHTVIYNDADIPALEKQLDRVLHDLQITI